MVCREIYGGTKVLVANTEDSASQDNTSGGVGELVGLWDVA
jgi:hypothetical protein